MDLKVTFSVKEAQNVVSGGGYISTGLREERIFQLFCSVLISYKLKSEHEAIKYTVIANGQKSKKIIIIIIHTKWKEK